MRLKFVSIFFIFCLSTSLSARELLEVGGTGDSQKLLRAVATLFERNNPGTEISVPNSIGSGGGIKAVSNGKMVLARTARAIKAKEQDDLIEYAFASSPIVFATHESVVGVDNINQSLILDIYSGKVKNWQVLGGPTHKIYPIHRENKDSSRKAVDRYIDGFEEINAIAKIIDSTPKAIAAIAKYQYTIGYFPLSEVPRMGVNVLRYNQIEADIENVKSGAYPLVNKLYLVSKGKPKGLAKQFVDFMYSQEAQKLIIEHGLVPVKN